MSDTHHSAATVSPIDSSVLAHPPAAMRPDSTCSSPTSSERPIRRNVLIVGDAGVGKSSLVNLISGRDVATTSSGAKTCTLQSQEYVIPLDGVEFALHDTTGLCEARGKMKAEYLDTVYQTYALISSLERSGGIDLLVFCMKGGRVSITMQQTYNLFVDVFFHRQVPVVIVVTHLEMYDSMEQWWNENEADIKEYGLKSHGHACITTTRGYKNIFSDKYDQSREITWKLLLDYSDRVAWMEEKASWFERVVLHIRSWPSLGHAKQLNSSDLRGKLIKRCGFSAEDAESVTQKIEQSQRMSTDAPAEDESWFNNDFGANNDIHVSLQPIRRNILIVGDVGVGKSSLVNLISGRDVATTSSGTKACTLQSQEHVVAFDGVEFALHDTAGLCEAQDKMKKAEYLDAVYQAYALISRLERSGGIDLLVFCMKGGRIPITMQQTHSLFVEVFCNRQVPVGIVVTHLEMYDSMEQWWSENEAAVKEYGLRSHGHACITTTRGYENAFSDKYDQSREIIRKFLLEHSDRVAWKEKTNWVERAVLQMRSWPSLRRAKQLDGSDLKKKLIKWCGFSVEDAEFVAQEIEQVWRTSVDTFDEMFETNSSICVSLAGMSCTS